MTAILFYFFAPQVAAATPDPSPGMAVWSGGKWGPGKGGDEGGDGGEEGDEEKRKAQKRRELLQADQELSEEKKEELRQQALRIVAECTGTAPETAGASSSAAAFPPTPPGLDGTGPASAADAENATGPAAFFAAELAGAAAAEPAAATAAEPAAATAAAADAEPETEPAPGDADDGRSEVSQGWGNWQAMQQLRSSQPTTAASEAAANRVVQARQTVL